MKAIQLQQIDSSPYLKVVNNSLTKTNAISEQVKRVYINTLVPGFNYLNSTGESITPKNCILL
jgi:hypothetical protein